jgi:hypothetical protein
MIVPKGDAMVLRDATSADRKWIADLLRKRNPSISLIGQHGIPIHDELELCLALN